MMAAARLILVLNSGSSSIKFRLYRNTTVLAEGQISGLGARPEIDYVSKQTGIRTKAQLPTDDATHKDALDSLLPLLLRETDGQDVAAVGHRVVHGGIRFSQPAVIDRAVRAELERLIPLAPLHQPHNLAGVDAATLAFPTATQVACFDTAFHRGHPWVQDTFALPRSFYDEGVRRYGFHGLSYEYICDHLAQHHPDLFAGRVVVAHLGNGASMSAIKNGRSLGSTMGFTALDGLAMGTRCGQLDPGVLLYLMSEKAMSAEEISNLLYTESGLKGLSGESQDMRILLTSSSPAAREAIDYYVARIRRELGALAAVLNGLDTLVFTGGIGENAAQIREEVCADQDWLGLVIDAERNRSGTEIISAPASRIKVLVIRTNKEEMIRRHADKLLAPASL
ncbi:acetate/propionate family kinase [Roseibium sediminis]|uniref:acetate/propionate family kinase n=1 Tax=Roseibium sediminis TaxID=1775174 RepID=UPI003CC7D2E2